MRAPLGVVAFTARVLWTILGALVIGAAVFAVIFPARAYMAKKDEVEQTRIELVSVNSRIAELESEISDFGNRTAVARIARERFGLVSEGEQLYRLSARPEEAARFPEMWPWPGMERLVRGS